MDAHPEDPLFDRLAGCFRMVFPDLDRGRLTGATHDNVAGWDSLKQVTLLSLMQEEFGVDIDFEEIESASFADMLALVRAKTVHG